ncbi:MAG TPA: hypothetical protein VHX42_04160 [Candidatus Babeliales bacterium]|nr:hypothetical protein [Candidatus Babeliales bacterium]
MKTKLLLIAIALLIGIQLKMTVSSENQSWYDYLRSKWTTLISSRLGQLTQEKGPMVAAAGLSSKLGSYAGIIPVEYVQWLGISFPVGLVIIGLVYNIDSIISYYQTGSFSKTDAIIKIKGTLAQAISNATLYPTRSSKIHALLKKDEFLQYINDKHGLVQEACAALSQEVSNLPYSDEQKAKDKTIDTAMDKVKKSIINYETLDDQIAALENQKQNNMDIPAMQAYLSIYFRLKNKQAVESKLSLEEKASRQKWATEAEKVRVSEPQVD